MKNIVSKSTMLLALLIIIWGASWPAYKIALDYTPPILFGGLRAFFGGLFLSIFIWKSRDEINWKKNWKKYLISAFFNTFLLFGLQSIGLIYLPGGLFSVLVFMQPILLAVFAWLLLGEYLSGIRVVGLVIGFIGIIFASVDGITTHFSVIGVILALASAVIWAYGVIYIKKVNREINVYWMVALQSIIGGALLLGIGSPLENWSDIVWNGSFIFGLSYGMIFGIPIAFILYYKLVSEGEASKVGSATFLIPIIAVLLGVIFLGEPLTYTLLLGMVLVGLSIYLVNFNEEKMLLKKREKQG